MQLKSILLVPFLALPACSQLPEAKVQRQIDVFGCRVAALQPYVGEVYDTADLVRDILAGKADPLGVLRGLGHSESSVEAAAEDWFACSGPRPAPALEQG